VAAPRFDGFLLAAGRQRHRAEHDGGPRRKHVFHASLGLRRLALGIGANDVSELRLVQGGEHIVVVRFLIHEVECPHTVWEGRGDLQSHVLPPRGFLGGSRFGACGLHALTRRHAVVRHRVLKDVRMHSHHAQRFPRLVGGDRQGNMPEKSLGASADRTQAFAVADKAKRRRVMHDSDNRVLTQPLAGLAQVSTEHPPHRDLRIGEEPIQPLAVGDRRHLFGKAIAGLRRRQRHNASQSVVEPHIAQRIAREFRGDLTHIKLAGFAHDTIRSQALHERQRCVGS
jgi:hypothetical protein